MCQFNSFSLNDWLTYQERLHPRTIELGLERVGTVLGHLGWKKPPPFTVVTVAGTNGKGSCVAMLEAIFQNAGYSTATYTSPHLLRYNERIHLNGREVTDEELCTAFARIEVARGETSLTYFEYGTLAALDLFWGVRPDVVILEVGLGGRLDATNVIDADVAVVTTVDLDHMDWLGPNRESIGREKAGIFRSGRPAICGDPDPPASLMDYAQVLGAPLYIQGRDFGWNFSDVGIKEKNKIPQNENWEWWEKVHVPRTWRTLPAPRMQGIYQYQNAATSFMAVACLSDRLPVSTDALHHALLEVTVAGRFQVLGGAVPHILDVAHNPQAAAGLAATLRTMPSESGRWRRTVAVVAMLMDKDISATLDAMIDVVDTWCLASLPIARGASAERLATALTALNDTVSIQIHIDVGTALTAARSLTTTGDRIVIFGSFHTVSATLRIINS